MWRLITDDNVSASFGLAADEYMTGQVGARASAPILRLYTYAPYAALVGRHQNVDNEINRAYCDAHGIAINRRPTGGGAIMMGAQQLGIALSVPLDAADHAHHRIRELFAKFSRGVIAGLAALGVRAEFGGKNDVEIGNKKLAGLGIYRDQAGGLLFHASVLVDLDIAQMLRILKTPFEKISDKAIATVAQRVTTICREAGRAVSLADARAAMAEGYARLFDATLEPSAFRADERAGIAQLEREKYLTRAWVDQKVTTDGLWGSARVKTPGGLLTAQLTLAGDVIKSVYLTGDFFAEDASVAALENALRWRAADAPAIQASVANYFAQSPDNFDRIAPADFISVLTRAMDDARQKANAAQPYGCFVNP